MAQFLAQVLRPQDQALVTDLTSSADELRQGVDSLALRDPVGTQLGDPCPPLRNIPLPGLGEFCAASAAIEAAQGAGSAKA